MVVSKKKLRPDLIIDLVEVLVNLKDRLDTVNFLQDVLTLTEIKNVSRRLRTAKLLIKGYSYDQIIDELKTSPITIARVQTWLNTDGLRLKKFLSKLPSDNRYRSPRRSLLTYYGHDPVRTLVDNV